MFTPTFALQLTAAERAELDAMTRATRIPAGLARRARLILALAAGTPYDTITGALGFAPSSISRWKRRFHRARVMGLRDAPRGGRPDRLSPAREAKIIAATQRPPPAPYTHWSVRRLARRLGVSPATVHRVWQRAGLKPHRFGRYVASPDPDFEQKAADIIGLYLQPPAHAAVFCVDEKTAIQALDRRDPVLPLSPGRAERHGFEYVRHGALVVCRARRGNGAGGGPHRAAPHQQRVPGVPRPARRDPAPVPRHSSHRRQLLGAQDQGGRGLARGPP